MSHRYPFTEDLDLDLPTTALLCPDEQHDSFAGHYRMPLHTVRETVRALLESVAEAGGWDHPTADEVTWGRDRDE
jgi:hypothetical protein